MAELPTPEEIKELLEAGIPAAQLGEMWRRGNFDAALMEARKRSGQLGPKQGWARPQSAGVNPRALLAAGGILAAGPLATPVASNAGFLNLFRNSIPGRAQKNPLFNIGRGARRALGGPASAFRTGSAITRRLGGSIAKPGRDFGEKAQGRIIREAQEPGEDFGEYPEFTPPQIEMRDFTGQGQQIAGSIYAPQFAAIDSASKGAQQQYGRSDKVIEGLYRNLVDSIAQRQVATDKQYGQAVAGEKAGGQKLVQDIGNTYKASQNQQADLMAKLGLEEAAPDTLTRGTEDQAYQQSMAQRASQSQQQALGTMRQGQADYSKNIQNASQTQGTVSRENLLNDLSQVLRMYDQQRMGVTSDQSNAAMEIANRLSDRDLDVQRMQYGAYGDSYDANVRRYESGRDQYNQGRNYTAGLESDRRQQANLDRDYELDLSKYQTDLATQQAKLQMEQAAAGQDESQTDVSDLDPVSRIIEQTDRQYGPGTGPQYYDFVDQYMRSLSGKGVSFAERYALNPSLFLMEVSDAAQQKGLNPRVAQAVAQGYFQMLRRSSGS